VTLASWNEGAARGAILGYLARIEDEVAPSDRIAVVDNDGTLWCEKPGYVQAFFLLQRLHEQAAADPDLAARDVVQALLANDLAAAQEAGPAEMAGVLMNTYAGLTTEEFDAAVVRWLEGFRHPRFGVPFGGLVYAPMLELLELLRAHGFRVYIVTGGGVDFVRPIGAQLYGVETDDIIGSAVEVEFERRDGRVVLMRTARPAGSPNEGPPKVVSIHSHIGRRPIVAIGNTAGDREMLEFAHTGELPSLCLAIDHDDAEREYAYGGEALTNPDAETLVTTAERFGWTVVSMRRDWSRVFA
jgi:phosphoserine phosphatase